MCNLGKNPLISRAACVSERDCLLEMRIRRFAVANVSAENADRAMRRKKGKLLARTGRTLQRPHGMVPGRRRIPRGTMPFGFEDFELGPTERRIHEIKPAAVEIEPAAGGRQVAAIECKTRGQPLKRKLLKPA